MRIAITGASGLVGTRLTTALRARGDEVVPFVRAAGRTGVRWDPATGDLDTAALGTVDAVVHVAGEGIANGRWTAARMARMHESRGPATERLCRALAALPVPPRVVVAASGVGIYGDRGDEELDERSTIGSGFLAELARAWEAGTAPAAAAGMRVVNLRIGLVLARHGGALPRMLLPFRLGLGGRLGSGRQWMSWLTLDDLARAILFAIDTEALRGPVVAASPGPVTNREFTRVLARALHRPAVLPVPAFALRLLFGSMAGELLLAGQRALPRALLAAGFDFADAELAAAFATVLAAKG
ncbi:MAG: TIGR01777 family oxidoreductase [Planctomycetota bacterium]